NIKEISLARSYGDLSENFEYKAAKQMQAVLARQRAELEQALQNARGTAFENPDTSRVSIGTIVTVRDKASKKQETYTILGAWDGNPDRNVISYQTAIGQGLVRHLGRHLAESSRQDRNRHRADTCRRRLRPRVHCFDCRELHAGVVDLATKCATCRVRPWRLAHLLVRVRVRRIRHHFRLLRF